MMNSESAAEKSIKNVLEAIDQTKSLPQQIFNGKWSAFAFFPSEEIFIRPFIDAAKDLFTVEKSSRLSIVNFTRLQLSGDMDSSLLVVTPETSKDEYMFAINSLSEIPNSYYSLDYYGCSSEIGDWCIYAEGSNDVGLIAFKEALNLHRFSSALEKLGASPIRDLLDRGVAAEIPFGQLTDSWRVGLLENYSY
jgi:hypothetical protein